MVIKFSVKIDGETESFAQDAFFDATSTLSLRNPEFVLKQNALDLVKRFFDDNSDKILEFIEAEQEIAKLQREKQESDLRLQSALAARKKKDVR